MTHLFRWKNDPLEDRCAGLRRLLRAPWASEVPGAGGPELTEADGVEPTGLKCALLQDRGGEKKNGYTQKMKAPILYCWWVGSLDFNLLDSPHMSFSPANSETFCWGIYSTHAYLSIHSTLRHKSFHVLQYIPTAILHCCWYVLFILSGMHKRPRVGMALTWCLDLGLKLWFRRRHQSTSPIKGKLRWFGSDLVLLGL